MKNKNALYIVLGIGAGIVAYYLFCKKKSEEGQVEVKSEGEPVSKKVPPTGGGSTPISTPKLITPKVITPILTTTPLVVNVSTTSPATTTTATSGKVDITPVTSPVSSTTTTRPTTTSEVSVKPTTTTAPTTTTTAISTPLKTSSFEGIGQQCFEVGECLNDL